MYRPIDQCTVVVRYGIFLQTLLNLDIVQLYWACASTCTEYMNVHVMCVSYIIIIIILRQIATKGRSCDTNIALFPWFSITNTNGRIARKDVFWHFLRNPRHSTVLRYVLNDIWAGEVIILLFSYFTTSIPADCGIAGTDGRRSRTKICKNQ